MITRSHHALIVLLACGTLARCNCETEEFIPSGTYMPGQVLDFGEVGVDAERTKGIEVRSDGRAALVIASINEQFDADDAGKWEVVMDEQLMLGLSPGQTATIAVTYRPCPDAWSGDTLTDGFDFNTCPGDPDSGDLNITDNSRVQNKVINVSGLPVQPATVKVKCPVGGGAAQCNVDEPDLMVCNGINYGPVTAGETPCDLVIEIENEWRNNKPVGTLNIDTVSVEVRDLNSSDMSTFQGKDVGFEILNMDGSPLIINSNTPLQVPIASGATKGTKRFKLRFTGAKSGFWAGLPNEGNGLRFFTSDPDRRVVAMNISAQGAAANVQCFPPQIDFGPVQQATTATAAFNCQNAGDATLEVNSMMIESGNPELQFTTTQGNPAFSVAPFQAFTINVAYTPADGGIDIENLLIATNDITKPNGILSLPIRGGAVPTCSAPDNLTWALPPDSMPPLPPRTEILTILSTGFGDLTVERLDIIEDNTSKDDFTIDLPECQNGVPCTLNRTLPAMTGRLDIPIIYKNTDISTTDSVNLHVYTNDPGNPDKIVILQAMDDPCFFPMGNIQVTTPRPCVGQAVEVSAAASNPGGNGMSTTIQTYRWHWLFSPPPPPQFAPQGMSFTTFIPERDGIYFLGLDVTNDCGAMSQGPATEMINISAVCN